MKEIGLRSRLTTLWLRWRHHEFWPAWLFYLPLLPWCILLALRHRAPLAFLAANPGIELGGGWVNESKSKILTGLSASPAGRRATLPCVLIPAGPPPHHRAHAAHLAITSDPGLAGYPVILKPDAGQRGFAIKLARSRPDVDAYFLHNTRDVLIQKYHPGPHECGILWVRHPAPRTLPDGTTETGFIFAVTHKEFPVITGDGTRTLRDLILAHPRFRAQAGVFLERWSAQFERVLARGESLRLAEAGNHCQGTRFSDGMHLVTPALERAIDEIASGFRGEAHGELDFGRFDIRYESEDSLREGRGLAIVELNGTSSEATSLYDPDHSPLWAYTLLFRQWAHLYRLGAARLRQGHRAMTLAQLRAQMRAHYTDRPGSALAD